MTRMVSGINWPPSTPMPSLFVLFLILLLAPLAQAQTQLRFVTWQPETETAWVWDKAIFDFEARHAGVKVVREVGPHSSTEFHDLVTQKLRNRDPQMDVFFMDVIWPAEFAAAGWALPLDTFFPAPERQSFFAAPIQADSYEGRIYGVPVFIDTGMLYYRKDLLDKRDLSPPRTWPELVRQAKLILAQERDPYLTGYSAQFKQYEGLVCNMMEFILGNGATLWDERRLQSTLNDAKAKEAVRFVRDQIIAAFLPIKNPNRWRCSPREKPFSTAIGLTLGPWPMIPGSRKWWAKSVSCCCQRFPDRKVLAPWAVGNWPSAASRVIPNWRGNSSSI